MNSCIPCYWTTHSINVICGVFSSNNNLFTVNFYVCVLHLGATVAEQQYLI